MEASGLDGLAEALALADDERARDCLGHAEVVDVAVGEPTVVVDDREVVAACQTKSGVDVASVARAVVDDDDPLAFGRERRHASAEGVIRFLVERPVRDDETQRRQGVTRREFQIEPRLFAHFRPRSHAGESITGRARAF